MHLTTRWIAPIVSAAMVISSIAAAACAQTRATKTEELQGGRWIAVDKAATQATVDPELIRVEELISAGHYSQAGSRAVAWLLRNPTSPMKDRGLFLNAEALYRYGDRVKSFYYLDQLMDEFPESRLFYPRLRSSTRSPKTFCRPTVIDRTKAVSLAWRSSGVRKRRSR